MVRVISLLICILFSLIVHAEDQAKTSSIGYPSVEAALDDLKSNPNASIRIEQDWTIVQVKNDNEMAIWSFTPESHPAHPAAIKQRIVFERDGAVWIDLKDLCQAEKDDCDKLVKQFEELNKRIKKRLSGGA